MKRILVVTSDSGGPAELVQDGITGFVLSPYPAQFAGVIDRLAEDVSLAEKLGDQVRDFIRSITWEDTVKALVMD